MDLSTSSLAVGAVFDTRTELKGAGADLAINNNFEFTTIKSDNRRYTIASKVTECNWRLHTAAIEPTSRFYIKMFTDTHDCFGLERISNAAASESLIASKIKDKLMQQPSYKPADIVLDMQRELGVKITYSKAWRSKELAVKQINGS